MSVSSERQRGGRVLGNREVSQIVIAAPRGDMSAAGGGVYLEEEEGSRGKHGCPRGSEAQPSDAVEGQTP